MNDSDVTGSDFAVQITGLPEHKNLKDLKCKMWAHIEQVMAREQLMLANPKSGTEDEAQNLVMDVNIGLNDYGRM